MPKDSKIRVAHFYLIYFFKKKKQTKDKMLQHPPVNLSFPPHQLLSSGQFELCFIRNGHLQNYEILFSFEKICIRQKEISFVLGKRKAEFCVVCQQLACPKSHCALVMSYNTLGDGENHFVEGDLGWGGGIILKLN